jgi:hypothetical protein
MLINASSLMHKAFNLRKLIMKKTLKASFILAGIALSATSIAAQQSFYLGGQASYNWLSGRASINDYQGVGVGFNLGYNFKIAPKVFLAPELAYDYLGSINSINVSAVSLLAKATYCFKPNLDFFVKGGVLRQYVEISGFSGNSDLTGSLGFGVAYALNKNWELFTQYTHMFGSSINNMTSNRLQYDNLGFGATYNFA